jgi:hypothetical protein
MGIQNNIFEAMTIVGRYDIYYDSKTNDILQHVEGYFNNLLATDRTQANRNLHNRILGSDTRDSIIYGRHFLIPQLLCIKFLEELSEAAVSLNCYDLLEFIDEFTEFIDKKYCDEDGYLTDLLFVERISTVFYKKLEQWTNLNNIGYEQVNQIISLTRLRIVETFLNRINENR